MVEAGGSSWHQSNRGISIYLAIYFALFSIVLLLSKFLHVRPRLASLLPEAAMIILVGIVAGAIFNLIFVNSDNNQEDDDAAVDENDVDLVTEDMVESFLSFSPNVFFVVLLPPIIFNSGYHLRRSLFFRHIVPICLFACVGTTMAAFILAGFLHVTRSAFPEFQPSFLELLAFGALISATDPVSTLAVFQAKQVDPHLFYLVFGESVINDAVGLVLFEAVAHLVEQFHDQPDIGAEVIQFVFDFFVGFVGSMILGLLTGLFTAWMFKVVDMRCTPLLELCMYVPIMYTPFVLAEVARLSGIVTVLFAGITAKRYVEPNLSSDTAANAVTIFRVVSHVTETVIFLELGLSVFGLSSHGTVHVTFILLSFLGCLLSRGLNIYPITFLYNNCCSGGGRGRRRQNADTGSSKGGELVPTTRQKMNDLDGVNGTSSDVVTMIDDRKIPWKAAHMLFFSGLRGAVSYALVRTFPHTGNQLSFVMTTMIIVLTTTFVLGGTTELALQSLEIETGVDEVQYMKSLERRYFLQGAVHRFEAYTLRRWVIRDFEKKTVQEALEEDDDLPWNHNHDDYIEHKDDIEMTERDHNKTIKRKKSSLFDFGK